LRRSLQRIQVFGLAIQQRKKHGEETYLQDCILAAELKDVIRAVEDSGLFRRRDNAKR